MPHLARSRYSLLSRRRLWPLALAAILITAGLLSAAEDPIAVSSQVFNGYTRTRLPYNSFKPEAYVFGEGGCWTRPVKDSAMEAMTFLRVAHAVALPLARLNYRPAHTAAEAELLILVFWGSTEGSRDHDSSGSVDRFSSASANYAAAKNGDHASKTDSASGPAPAIAAAESAYSDSLWQLELQNADRDHLDNRNARILGYTDSLDRARFASHMSFAQDVLSEVGSNRYYVVLQAYDNKTALKEKKLKPLWTARISMNESGNDFSKALDQMLQNAARYFGQDSNGLHREVTREGKVKLAPTEFLETLPAK